LDFPAGRRARSSVFYRIAIVQWEFARYFHRENNNEVNCLKQAVTRMLITRRSILRYAAIFATAPATVVGAASPLSVSVQYRARATVLLLAMPLLHRENVGSGYLNVREQEGEGNRQVHLEFGAGSLPERAAGLNRLGIFEERVIETSGGAIESVSYFGYMTTSNEKDLNQARKALETGAEVSYTAIRGKIDGGKLWNRLMKVSDGAKAGWSDRARLTSMIRTRLLEAEPAGAQHSTASVDGTPCGTFLHAIRCAMRSTSPKSESRFIHNGKVHQLRTQKGGADKAGMAEMEGKILSDSGKDLSAFKLWFEPASAQAYPVRFEFRARSFLRLTFERV
jgi:hypothetical protein